MSQQTNQPRKKRILWANPYCLLDTSSGASITVRQILMDLAESGHKVAILGATIFDSPNGISRIRAHWQKIHETNGHSVIINDGALKHRLVKTKNTYRKALTAEEEGYWYNNYIALLDQFKPDVVMYYGGRTLDLLIGDEAHSRGIPVAAFLYNGNFSGKRWCRDVDVIFTDSKATAKFYEDRYNLNVVPIGPFVDPKSVVPKNCQPERILFINPSLAKGALLVAHLAILMEKTRPDIQFEVVESRGNWASIVRLATKSLGKERSQLTNVVVTPNTTDMRPIYGRARVILIPSLWWESFPRVSIESLMNGIPAVVTNRGGLPEAIGKSGHIVPIPDDYYQAPYNKMPTPEITQALCDAALDLYESSDLSVKARVTAQAKKLNKKNSLRKLENELEKLVI